MASVAVGPVSSDGFCRIRAVVEQKHLHCNEVGCPPARLVGLGCLRQGLSCG